MSLEYWDAWLDRGDSVGFCLTDWLFLRDTVLPLFDQVARGGSLDRRRELRQSQKDLEEYAAKRARAPWAATEVADPDEVTLAAVLTIA